MPVAVRLVEVLAIVSLVATMAAGAAVIIFMEKCLHFLVMIIDPLVASINFILGVLKFVFLKIIYKLTYIMEHLTATLWDKSSQKCPS
ncbi:hypothetical protein Phum_PHUM273630 [Pediculus humanus corporis]|uniref:Uncharacterized protein n=1 Tax=Pediculus humanus subsp. corporis TaxID=121224 RepID=E0VKW5_PEDHC|nr:uncharacterized protein Phum_PHUM273630 [Pediculus humanus corporis]EEB14021.1 hypothetical protein Phum_PHUM273630 [Pediculus humanus corporis]